MEEKTIKVIWLEENIFVHDQYVTKALQYDIDLQRYTCWSDAKDALNANVKGWSAIIMNPKCKLGRGDKPKPQKFLPQVFCDITSLSIKLDTIIPWYIFTDLEPSTFEDLIISDRAKYDGEWERPYYSMDTDADMLFSRVRMQATSRDRIKIREGVHKELFEKLSALTNFGLVQEDFYTMEDIMISLYEGKMSHRCNFINLRKIIESLIKSMISYGFLPDDIKNIMGETNFIGCTRLLAGLDCNNGSYVYRPLIPIIDKLAGKNLLNLLTLCHGYAHTGGGSLSDNRKDTNGYLGSVNTNNLLHASALMLADIIIMYYDHLLANGRNDGTRKYWT